MIEFHGFNACKRKVEDGFTIINSLHGLFDNLYLTFDSIYSLINKSQIYKLNATTFEKEIEIENESILCTNNTNYLWVLAKKNKKKDSCLYQYENGAKLVNKFDVNLVNEENLMIVATDVNVYIFHHQSDDGFECVYELKSEQKGRQKQQMEAQLNESATSSIPINRIFFNDRVEQMQAGKEHVLMLTASQRLYSFGLGTKGQLGHAKIENTYEPKIIVFENPIIQISAGGWHSGCIDSENSCFTWGWNSHGQLGFIHTQSVFVSTPTKLLVYDDESGLEVKFKHISLGARHSCLIDTNDNLYTFGWNKYNQLAINHEIDDDDDDDENRFDICEPYKVEKKLVKNVKAGCWYTILEEFNKDN